MEGRACYKRSAQGVSGDPKGSEGPQDKDQQKITVLQVKRLGFGQQHECSQGSTHGTHQGLFIMRVLVSKAWVSACFQVILVTLASLSFILFSRKWGSSYLPHLTVGPYEYYVITLCLLFPC